MLQSASGCDLSRLSQTRGVRPSQPFRKPERPDRDKREKENSSTRQERKREIWVHDILLREMIGCSLGSTLPLPWCQPSRDFSDGQGRRLAIRRAVSLIRSSLQKQDRFKN